MCLASIAMLHDYDNALQDLFLSGIERPLIEPWFYTSALLFSSFVFSSAFMARAIILKKGTSYVFAIGAAVQLIAILNGTRYYLFVPLVIVSMFVITAVLVTIAIAGVDLITSRKENGKSEPNQTPQPTPLLCSPSNQTSSVRRG
jgi:hypothetical protein